MGIMSMQAFTQSLDVWFFFLILAERRLEKKNLSKANTKTNHWKLKLQLYS